MSINASDYLQANLALITTNLYCLNNEIMMKNIYYLLLLT